MGKGASTSPNCAGMLLFYGKTNQCGMSWSMTTIRVCNPHLTVQHFQGQDEAGSLPLGFALLHLSFVILGFEFRWPSSS